MHDFLIIGGGVIGLTCALRLAEAGASVTLLERGEFGRESSWAGGGILAPLYPWRYAETINALALRGRQLYDQWLPRLHRQSGIDPELHRCGLLLLDSDCIAEASDWARQWRHAWVRLDGAALTTHFPTLSPRTGEALWLPEQASLRNPRLLQALLAVLADMPRVRLVPQCTVSGLRTVGGRVEAVLGSQGEWCADQVIVTAGAWSSSLLPTPPTLPVTPVRGQMLLYQGNGLLSTMLLAAGHYLIPRRDGLILVGSTVEQVGFDCAVTAAARTELMAVAGQLLPALAEREPVAHWAGLRPGAPQGTPFIGRWPGIDNLHLNCGHFRNGLVMAPAAAELLVDLLLGQPPRVDAAAFDPARLLAAAAIRD